MQQGWLFFFSFLYSFFKDLLQVLPSFTEVQPERQVQSVTKKQPQQAVEFGLSIFRMLEAIWLPLWLFIFLYFRGTVFCTPAKVKLKFPMILIYLTKASFWLPPLTTTNSGGSAVRTSVADITLKIGNLNEVLGEQWPGWPLSDPALQRS